MATELGQEKQQIKIARKIRTAQTTEYLAPIRIATHCDFYAENNWGGDSNTVSRERPL